PTIQMRSWLFTSNLINFSSGTAAASTQITGTSGTGAYQVSAAAFNATNQLLFFVGRSSFTSQNGSYSANTVFTPSNQVVGTLNFLVNPNKGYQETDWVIRGKETVVVPVLSTTDGTTVGRLLKAD
ncbi:MAG: hypothetical protein M3Y54_20960, partial [Bacteroidota bacterium]|nr:hypothetical protein [Bacteroidota bacterium]